MAKLHNYRYLNQGNVASGESLFSSKMATEIAKAQKKAPPKQWAAFINGLASKGVKSLEIAESGVIGYLESQPDSVKSLTREEIVAWLNSNTPTIKELELSNPKYSSYSQPRNPEDSYHETLYVLNSQRDNIDDRLADIRFELEELDFDLELLSQDPMKALNLHNEQISLTEMRKTAKDVTFGHYSDITDPNTGKQIANMIAHTRTTQRGDLFFIEEIQSDWAQRGRRSDWSRISKGPWVTHTELWAGLILRRQLQRAAMDPTKNTIAWITGDMRNGSQHVSNDGLNDFYLKILPKLADKMISGTGEKTKMIKVTLGKNEFDVPGIMITDKVREKMKMSQPLYSRDVLAMHFKDTPAPRIEDLEMELKKAHEMLGNSVAIRLAAKVLDVATGEEVAGRQIGRIIDVSLNARNPALALSHEVWHYADQYLISEDDRDAVYRAFADGTRLNQRVREELVRDGAPPEAIAQCNDAHEAAAHGFSLWVSGKIGLTMNEEHDREEKGNDVMDHTIGRIFRKVEKAFIGLAQWATRIIGETTGMKANRTASDVFTKLREGRLQEANIAPIEDFLNPDQGMDDSLNIQTATRMRFKS